MDFNTICRKIKNLEIQGAANVAKAGVQALKLKHDANSVKKILSLRPTEPCLQNAVKFVLQDVKKNYPLAMHHFEEAQKKIDEYGANIIKQNSIIFTHCHSSAVTSILQKAKKSGKNFEVCNTETRPKFQGRITAEELAKAGIKVSHFVDSAMRIALKKADIALIGADAIMSSGKVANKIGSELVAEVANRYDIPFYVCTDSWKFDHESAFGKGVEIEKRSPKEVWEKPPKGVTINNVAFEFVNPNLITAIISELGILTPETFIEEVLKNYPWLKG
ncbi:hypothetical protein HY643_00590 [Candidatus Woesearchaeota archaeon]|nr:hypothetical protein [Candidatus Woesearchaeota archaeon]